jgi:hypothetical protein
MRPAPHHSLRLLAGRAAALIVCAIVPWLSRASGQAMNEATAKIQFMHYVAQYAVWPAEVLPATEKRFVIGILGENTFGEALEDYFRGKTVRKRAFVIRYFSSVEEVKDCQMLFISSSEKSDFALILSALEDRSILTISDSEGFTQKNGMIHMYITAKSEISGGLGWDINPQALKRAKLQIDPFFIEKARKQNR